MDLEKISHRVAPWVLPILLLAVWQLSVSAGWLSTRILPAPVAVVWSGLCNFLGVLLSSPIEVKEIAGKKVFNVADGFLLACFDHDVTEETVKAIAQMKPYYAVFRDSSMANDSVATNFDQIFETYSPDTVRKVL